MRHPQQSERLPRFVVRYLQEREYYVNVFAIPLLLFMLDLLLRIVCSVDVIDAGADMALLAVSSFITVLAEPVEEAKQETVIELVFFLVCLIAWVFCLGLISRGEASTVLLFGRVDVRWMISWAVGLVTVVVSGAVLNELPVIGSG